MLSFELNASDGMPLLVQVTDNNVHIMDSYRIKDDREKILFISIIRLGAPEVWAKRTDESLLAEWKAHNALYRNDKWESHTKDVDLESKQSLFHKIAWFFVNILYKE